jgi:hypothetical protein
MKVFEVFEDGDGDHTASQWQARVDDDSSASENPPSDAPLEHGHFSTREDVADNTLTQTHSEALERVPLPKVYHARYHRGYRSSSSSPSSSPSPSPSLSSRPHSPYRARPGYPGAGGIYDVESEGADLVDTGESSPPEWVQQNTVLGDDMATELLIAHSIEHRVLKSGPEKVVLICPSGPPPSSHPSQEKAQGQFRWL